MKVLRTRTPEQEDKLLEEYAAPNKKNLQDARRETIRRLAQGDAVDPNDPIFTLPPAKPRTGRKRRIAERHDELLYGRKSRR